MKRNNLKYSLIFVVFILAFLPFVVHAAGAIQIPQTGQTMCYDAAGTVIPCLGTGQDGELQMGAALPTPRFTDKGDQTMLDNLTGLIWPNSATSPGPAVCSPGSYKTWQEALDYVKCLNTNNYLGHSDWRLPNRKELESLVNAGQSYSAYHGWSSSTFALFTYYAWVVYGDGFVDRSRKGESSSVWPVRSGQSGSSDSSIISLPRTGQTACYDATGNSIACAGTGQDGELQMGAAWPNPRFTDKGDQTVLDNLTGLIWINNGTGPWPAFCSIGGSTTWQEALDYVKCLNTNNYLGHSDWRLPNRKELESLFNAGQSNSANWLNLQGISNVPARDYWSSSTNVNYVNYAWVVDMDIGVVSNHKKSEQQASVWPVRSGQSGPFASLAVSVSGSGSGTIVSAPMGISCGSVCVTKYNSGINVTLTATTGSSSIFTGWSGDCSGTGACIVR